MKNTTKTILLDPMPLWHVTSAQLRLDIAAAVARGKAPEAYRGNLLTGGVPPIEMVLVPMATPRETLAIFDWDGQRRVMGFVSSPEEAMQQYFGLGPDYNYIIETGGIYA